MMKFPKKKRPSLWQPIAWALLFVSWISTLIISVQIPILSQAGVESGALYLTLTLPPFFWVIAFTDRSATLPFMTRGKLFILLLLPLLYTSLLRIIRVTEPSCLPTQGFKFFAIQVYPTLFLTAVLAVSLTHIFSRLLLQRIVALCLPFVGVLTAVPGFLRDPMFKFQSHFGPIIPFMPGTDESPGEVFYLYRTGTILFLVFGLYFTDLFFRHNHSSWHQGQKSDLGFTQKFIRLLLALVSLFSIQILLTNLAPSEMEEESRGVTRGAITVQTYDRKIDDETLTLVSLEAEYRLSHLLERLSLDEAQEPITINLYANARSMLNQTGSKRHDFAIPHKRTIHIRFKGFPLPTLEHELAHVVLGAWSDSYFSVPSSMGIPKTPLIEGFAMWAADDLNPWLELTLFQHAAALRQSGHLGKAAEWIDSSSLGFALSAPERVYYGFGAFIQYISTQMDKSELAKLYRFGSFSAIFPKKKAFVSLVADFDKALLEEPLPAATLEYFQSKRIKKSGLVVSCDDLKRGQDNAANALSPTEDLSVSGDNDSDTRFQLNSSDRLRVLAQTRQDMQKAGSSAQQRKNALVEMVMQAAIHDPAMGECADSVYAYLDTSGSSKPLREQLFSLSPEQCPATRYLKAFRHLRDGQIESALFEFNLIYNMEMALPEVVSKSVPEWIAEAHLRRGELQVALATYDRLQKQAQDVYKQKHYGQILALIAYLDNIEDTQAAAYLARLQSL